jgi:hypothetical protein
LALFLALRAAQTAASLDTMFPEKIPALKFRNPVLSAFANAVCHCSSTAEVSIVQLAEDGLKAKNEPL